MVCVFRGSTPGKFRADAQALRCRSASEGFVGAANIRLPDDVRSRSNAEHNVALNVPPWLLVAHVLRSTGHVSAMPGAFASAVQDTSLVIRELPFTLKPIDWRLC